MPQVFEIADRIHVHRLGRRTALVSPGACTMTEVVGLMTGALQTGADGTLVENSTQPMPENRSAAASHPSELPE
jgi:fructose transport system ATP-binding protein